MSIHYYSGSKEKIGQRFTQENGQLDFVRDRFSEFLEVKNLSFLLGAGCSSLRKGNSQELGIPVMKELAKMFIGEASDATKGIVSSYKDGKISNIESFLGYLYQKYQVAINEKQKDEPGRYQKAIDDTKKFIFDKCHNHNEEIIEVYKKFYRKLLFRSGNLPRVNVFTTNYDLNNERALDELGAVYCNGFSGFINRRYNPAIFKHGLYAEMDTKDKSLAQIDNYFFLYKLHGSINWVRDDSQKTFFGVTEKQEVGTKDARHMMIYPTPHKQEDSFGIPYSDMFREFQAKISRNNSVLVCIGYGFNDDHVNNIIFRAFTLPTFRLVILGDPKQESIKKLIALNDSRICVVNGEEQKSSGDGAEEEKVIYHYFKDFVEYVLPDIGQEKIDEQIRQTEEKLIEMENARGQV